MAASKKDIEAGKAVVKLATNNDALIKGLDQGKAALQLFATAAAGIGVALGTASAAILTPIAAAVNHFMTAGGAIDDMATRIGITRRELLFLQHALGQSGASIEDFEMAMTALRRKGLDPRDFEEIAEQLNAIADPVERDRKMLELFGRSGLMLKPLLANLKEMRSEWEKMGGGLVSEEDIKLADELGDSWDALHASFKLTAMQIGAALAPALLSMLDVARELATWVTRFVAANRTLVVAIAAIGVALGAASVAALTLAAGLSAVIGLIVGINALLALTPAGWIILAIVAAVVSLVVQMTLLVAITAAAIAAFLTFTKTGQALWAMMSAELKKFAEMFKLTFAGLSDAIRAGKIDLAWAIVMATMEVAWKSLVKVIYDDLNILLNRMSLLGGVLGLVPQLDGKTGLDAAARKLAGLRGQAADALSDSESGSWDGGQGALERGALVTGFSAGAAMRAGQMMGADSNPVVVEVKNLIAEAKENRKVLAAIHRKIDVPKFK